MMDHSPAVRSATPLRHQQGAEVAGKGTCGQARYPLALVGAHLLRKYAIALAGVSARSEEDILYYSTAGSLHLLKGWVDEEHIL